MAKKIIKRKKPMNPWTKHLMEFQKKHPDKTFTQCMKLAGKTYKKK